MTYKLGSLFDGSGGFPLAGSLCGITPVWASEVEPYPIAVTRSRFPDMKHLGDISKINGGEIEPVDIITFGSPCQDLSVAGKRAGLKHEVNGDDETTRSGLFMEAVRIIKEMREATNGKYPTYALWENVPGAFSSNKGEDFRIVLEELIKIVEPQAAMPPVPKGGWAYADSYCGDGWSLAYRVFDAQYWGVPQRRRRIHLVLDLRAERAREVLFEREGLRGYSAQGRTPWQSTPAHAEGSTGADDRALPYLLKIRSGCEGGGKGALWQENKSATISTLNDQYLFQPVPNILLDDQGGSQISVRTDDKSPTLRAEAHGNVPCVVESGGFCPEQSAKTRGIGWEEEMAPTLRAGVTPAVVYSIENHPADSRVKKEDTCYTLNTIDRPAVAFAMQGFGDYKESDVASGMKARDYKDATDLVVEEPICVADHPTPKFNESGVAYTMNARDYKAPLCAAYGIDVRNGAEYPELYPTLQAKPNGGQSLNFSGALRVRYIVRRLTPTECARLQGFADRWGDIDHKEDFTDEEYRFWLDVRNTHAVMNGRDEKEYTKAQMLKWYNGLHTDSAEYKMWGNGIALPPALYVLQGMADAFGADEEPAMAEEPKMDDPNAEYKALVARLRSTVSVSKRGMLDEAADAIERLLKEVAT